MSFKKFLEDTAGYYDDKEDVRPTGSGRQQELPGISMVLGQKNVDAKVTNIQQRDGYFILQLDSERIKEIEMPWQQYKKQAPKVGDTLALVINRDNSLQDYQIIHRH